MRPLGVVVIAVFMFVVGIISVVGGIFLFAMKSVLAKFLIEEYSDAIREMLNQSGIVLEVNKEILEGIILTSSYLAIFIGSAYLIAGFGLWKLKEWGRIATIIISGINVVYGLFIVFIDPLASFEIALNVVIIWYLMRRNVRERFVRKISIEERILGDQNP